MRRGFVFVLKSNYDPFDYTQGHGEQSRTMKKLLLLIIIAAALLFFMRGEKADIVSDKPTETSSFKPDPSNAIFPGIENDAATILEEKAYGDINNDQKIDTAIFLAERGGGSGVFIYAAAYISGPLNYKGTNAVFLGDRISPQGVSITNGVITVNYLDRKEDEPFAAEPTVMTSKQLVFKNGELVER